MAPIRLTFNQILPTYLPTYNNHTLFQPLNVSLVGGFPIHTATQKTQMITKLTAVGRSVYCENESEFTIER